jgi:hypothetical protein
MVLLLQALQEAKMLPDGTVNGGKLPAYPSEEEKPNRPDVDEIAVVERDADEESISKKRAVVGEKLVRRSTKHLDQEHVLVEDGSKQDRTRSLPPLPPTEIEIVAGEK